MHEYSAVPQQHPPEIESIPLDIECQLPAVNSIGENWSSAAAVGSPASTNTDRKRNWTNIESSSSQQYKNPDLHASNTSGKIVEQHTGASFNPKKLKSINLRSRSTPQHIARSVYPVQTTAGILTAAQPEHIELKKTVDQLKTLTTQGQITNPDLTDFYYHQEVPKKTALQRSPFYHLSGSLRSNMDDDSDISNQARTSRTTRSQSAVANEPEFTSVVSSNKPTEAPITATRFSKSGPPFLESKETSLAKTVEFFQARSFFGDTELHRMVGDLRKQMSTKGLCVFDHFMGEEKGKMILSDVLKLYEQGGFINGQLESSPNTPSSSSSSSPNQRVVRGDVITWLTGNEGGCNNIKYLMERIDATVMMCGENFGGYTIKQRTRAMVACYPGNGTYYLRHIDNPCQNGRVLTCIYYLNINWDACRDGGLLRIYPKGSPEVANVEPIFDRLLFFWSDSRNPHEVKPSYRGRFAITLWYYDEQEQAEWQRRRGAEVQTTPSSNP